MNAQPRQVKQDRRWTFHKAFRAVEQYPGLSSTEKRLIAVLLNLQQADGWTYAGQAALAQELSHSINYIKKLLARLVHKGFLIRRPGDGRGNLSRYRVLLSKLECSGDVGLSKARGKPVDKLLCLEQIRGSNRNTKGVPIGTLPYKEEKNYENCAPFNRSGPSTFLIPPYEKRLAFDPTKRSNGRDHLTECQRLAGGFKAGQWRYAQRQEEEPFMVDTVKWNRNAAWIGVAGRGTVRIRRGELECWKFWR